MLMNVMMATKVQVMDAIPFAELREDGHVVVVLLVYQMYALPCAVIGELQELSTVMMETTLMEMDAARFVMLNLECNVQGVVYTGETLAVKSVEMEEM